VPALYVSRCLPALRVWLVLRHPVHSAAEGGHYGNGALRGYAQPPVL
jgi:hypothetical protein